MTQLTHQNIRITRQITKLLLLTLFAVCMGWGASRVAGTRTAAPYSLTVGSKEEEVQAILRRFVLEADARRVKFRFSLSTIEIVPNMDAMMGGDLTLAQPLAYCTPGNNEIKINDLHWDSMNETAKEMVLFHELGHCMLERGHREDVDATGRHVSIMGSRKRFTKNQVYLDHRKEYLDELFDPKFRGDGDWLMGDLSRSETEYLTETSGANSEEDGYIYCRILVQNMSHKIPAPILDLALESCVTGYMKGRKVQYDIDRNKDTK